MKLFKQIILIGAITSAIILLNGCAKDLINVQPGSERVTLVDPTQVSNCQSKGGVTVTVVAKVGFINRSIEAVDANLEQLAKNAAVNAGGDTIVKGDRPDVGTRTFAVYKCRP